MSDDELRLILITALKYSLTADSTAISTPLGSLDLLSHVLTVPIPAGLLPHSPTPKFRLTDLDRFERFLEELSKTWEEGWIVLSRSTGSESGNLTIYEIGLGSGKQGPNGSLLSHSASISSTETTSTLRKRKRVVDEDADSAAGDGEDDDEPFVSLAGHSDFISLDGAGGSTLANLSPEMRKVYTFMQKETAKGRLLAERVSLNLILRPQMLKRMSFGSKTSFALKETVSNRFASTLQRMNVQKHEGRSPMATLTFQSVIASISAHSSALILTFPLVIAHTSILATRSQLMHSLHQYRHCHPRNIRMVMHTLGWLYRIHEGQCHCLLDLEQEAEAKRRLLAGIYITKWIVIHRLLAGR